MRDIEKLESYIENPLSSTILVVSYKEKKIDGRTKFAKLLKDRGIKACFGFIKDVVLGVIHNLVNKVLLLTF